MRTLRDYAAELAPILSRIARRVEFESAPDFAEIVREHPSLVIVMTHGSPLGWLPAISVLMTEGARHGGADRVPLGVIHKLFFTIPPLRPVARYVTQSDRHLGFDDLLARLTSGAHHDLALFPEGDNCFFGDCATVRPFPSTRFVELAVRSGVPLLVVAHVGSEPWSLRLPESPAIERLTGLVSRAIPHRIQAIGALNLPLPPAPMARFAMRCELYHPRPSAEDLRRDPEEKRRLLREEADAVRARMQAMLASLARPEK
jgi:hypothetical protein